MATKQTFAWASHYKLSLVAQSEASFHNSAMRLNINIDEMLVWEFSSCSSNIEVCSTDRNICPCPLYSMTQTATPATTVPLTDSYCT